MSERRHVTTRRVMRDGREAQLFELAALRLTVLDGEDRGSTWVSSQPLVRIGGAPENDVVLSDSTVSRFHATISWNPGGQILLRDLGSKNGTFVRGLRAVETHLVPGVEFTVGRTTLRLEPEKQDVYAWPGEGSHLGGLIGASAAMREVYGLIQAVAPTRASVLITGESGTGKRLAAQAIHDLSRRPGPMVLLDCASVGPDLIRSELYGHQKGAFTGADQDRRGAFREADRGTLFLDEIGELPLDLQPRLLQAIELREVQPLGADRRIPVDVRLITATNRDLAARVREGAFREDLYHRVNVLPIHLPALRDRPEDVPLLLEHFVRELGVDCRFGEDALEALQARAWSGNVRELRNLVERTGILHRGKEVRAADLGPAAAPVNVTLPASLADRVRETERDELERAIARCGGDKRKAAQMLGIGYSTLKRKLKESRG